MGAIELLVIVAMVLFNSVLAGYEIALASVSAARLHVLARENRTGAKAALYMKQRIEISLAAIQVGITFVGATAAATGGSGARDTIQPLLEGHLGLSAALASVLAIALVVLPLTLVTLVFGELVPKVFAIRNKEAVCLWLSPAVRWFAWSVWPAVRMFEILVTAILGWIERLFRSRASAARSAESSELQELRAQAASARAMRLIGERQEGIIVSAALLSSRPVREIMLPVDAISTLDVNASFAESLVAAHLEMHTRFPVTERKDDPQAIFGYVNFKDIVALMRLSHPHKLSLRNIVRSMPHLPEDMAIAACLERMTHEHAHIALVRDAAARIVGMITLEDILEELVGDIQDEYDRLPVHVIPAGAAWIVGGGTSLARLLDVTGLDLTGRMPEGNARNLNEWISGHLAGNPHGGDVVEADEVRVMVRKVRRQKVLEGQISRVARAPND